MKRNKNIIIIISIICLMGIVGCSKSSENNGVQEPKTQAQDKINSSNDLKLFPFGDESPIGFEYGKKIDIEKVENINGTPGYFDSIKKMENGLYSVTGWAYLEGKEFDYILIIDNNGETLGAAKLGGSRSDVVKVLKKDKALLSGWEGSVKLESGNKELTAIAKIKGEEKFIKLINIKTVAK